MESEKFVTYLGRERATAILRWHDQEVAAAAMEAAVRGGFRIIEFTLSVPGVFELIEEFSRREDIVTGAGTVLTAEEAEKSVAAGAKFLVSPVVDEVVIDAARDLGVAMMPGTHTATEMLRAYRAGAPLQKLFPAPGSGPAYVKACLGPMPFLRIVPTSGVDLENAAAWLQAGAYAVGFVAPLFVAEDLEARRFEKVEARAREMVAACRLQD